MTVTVFANETMTEISEKERKLINNCNKPTLATGGVTSDLERASADVDGAL